MLKFDRQGLLPVVIQDDSSNAVLMVAFMNEEALRLTRATGYTHFYSRSRNAIWRKGEQSGHVQAVRGIFVNCEENSLLIRVQQVEDAACHMGYHSCYYRQLLPNDTYETVAERVFNPEVVYSAVGGPSPLPAVSGNNFPIAIDYTISDEKLNPQLETTMRQLYNAYLYLRDHDLSEQSNTSYLLQERSPHYLITRLADELQELADVQTGEHVHSGREPDTILEASQVGYWLLLIAATYRLPYEDIMPHAAILQGYQDRYGYEKATETREECLNLLGTFDLAQIAPGLRIGFALIGWACAEAGVSPLAPAEYDLEQMRKKGLVKDEQ
ncbi:MAG: phosphoribosyl-AMP cyclohydrolase [Ktedonobacteraceae bacterium]